MLATASSYACTVSSSVSSSSVRLSAVSSSAKLTYLCASRRFSSCRSSFSSAMIAYPVCTMLCVTLSFTL